MNFCDQIHHGNYFCTEYEKSKVIADKIALDAASQGVPIIAVYPGVIYGPGKVTAGNLVARVVLSTCDFYCQQYLENTIALCVYLRTNFILIP